MHTRKVNFVQLTEVQMALGHWVRILLSGIKCSTLQTVFIGLFFYFFSGHVVIPHDTEMHRIVVLGPSVQICLTLGCEQRTPL